MKKTRLISSLAIAGATLMLLTACVGGNNTPKTTSTPLATSAVGGTGNASNTTKSTPAPEYTSSADPLSGDGFLDYAKSSFPDVTKGVGDYSKDDVLKALYTSKLYSNAAFDNSYFISGQWARDKYSQDKVSAYYDNFFSSTGMTLLLDRVSASTGGDNEASKIVFSTFNYLPDGTGTFKVCDSVTTTPTTCQIKGYLKYSNFTWSQQGDELVVKFTVESRVAMTKDGVSGYLPITDNVTLGMIKNDKYDGTVGTYPFLINDWNTHVSLTGFTS